MEFVGNQINFKTVLATLTVAFFIGRINLFEGTFPATVALITVMVAVSTVYIYLVPVIAVAMLTYGGAVLNLYGDMMAMIFCGIFFLFFHNHRFTINQRTSVAVAAVIVFNCAYYAYGHLTYLLSIETMIKETIAVIVFIRVFNTIARILFVGKNPMQISEEKIGLAYEIFLISLIGAIDSVQVVFPLWLLAIVVIQYCKGIQPAMAAAGIAAVFWQCQHVDYAELFIGLFAGMLTGWFLASLIDGKYRKTMLALTIFATIALSASDQIYGAAAAMALFIAVPSGIITRLWCVGEERFCQQSATGADLKLEAIRRDLMKKREVFLSLSKLYSAGMDNKQIVSYQFDGMARTVNELMQDLEGRGESSAARNAPQILVGSASYAFEAGSGDSCLSFSFGKNKQALIISDGMGKGSRAATESKLVVTTLSKLLSAGFDVDIAMKTVNAILMTGNSAEMFATVDLAIIDKVTGRAQIFKMGAASTYVKHNGSVSMLKRPAPPVGIVDGLKLEYIDVRLKRGDLLIMVSDGVTDCDRSDPDGQWLRERLTELGSRDPDTVAELIVNKAAEKYGIRERDDLTVMVAAI
ncbi:SpoIIE family protein phosphatase [Emergencia timonensis]|uniref:SpoIIE family protein phosphatase n=1 Tax=Emergencia timonensis TaxID=1776384 RepID=UPI0024203408|nr:SpoIIE family protein phosphatase [Emergencia timonensis]